MRRIFTTRYIPAGSREVQHPDGLGVCYVQEHQNGSGRMAYSVIAYTGKANKSAFYESHRTPEARDERIRAYFHDLDEHERMKAERRSDRSRPHTLKPGDIIHHSWGWEQTNCDFYQVLSVTPHGAVIREIGSRTVDGSTYTHGMADMRLPAPNNFCGEPLKVRIDGRNSVTSLEHGSAGVWDGQPKYCSWYA